MKNKTAYLREENLLTLLSQNNFIIPEIQREYVWGNNESVIVKFLKELKTKVGVICDKCHQPHSNEKINIGFLYSYKPDYVKVKQERFLDENLIDGQQRFTTLFLLLFYCALKENKKREFLALIRFEEDLSMNFNFKVRDLTRRFLLEFINKTDTVDNLKNIEKQSWFLNDYKHDVSIKAMIKALGYIIEAFEDESMYYNHFLTNIVFWHFKTEATSQGEELYITMNARGEELANNEITKAALMLSDDQLFKSGEKWEEWQQFFWKHRDKDSFHQSADAGFNGFLECIAGFEFYRLSKQGYEPEKDIQKLINIEKVEKYFKALKYLEDHKEDFKKEYPNYNTWVDIALETIWDLLNRENTNWFADYQDDSKGTEISRMVFVWSIFFYISKKKELGDIDPIETFRFVRLHYNRYHNYDRSILGIIHNVQSAVDNNPWHFLSTNDENLKYNFLKSLEGEDQKRCEEVIWQIEDHRLNLYGRDLAAINISHLVDFEKKPTIEDLERIKEAFDALFPDNSTQRFNLLRSTLLFRGVFWKDTSPGYYERYDFSEWRRHIRKPEFSMFFKDFINCGKNLKKLYHHEIGKFLIEKREEIENASIVLPEPSLHDRFKYYSVLIEPDAFWSVGEKIAIHHEVPEGEIRLFENENRILYNSKGSFHGNRGNVDLWKKAKYKYTNPLHYLKQQL